MLDEEKLFNWASKINERSEQSGNGSHWPTVREAARRFGCRQSEIIEVANSYSGKGYMRIAGYNCEGRDGDMIVEAY